MIFNKWKTNKKSRSGQDGFTLVEVMVAAGLIGVLAVALSNQSKLVFKSKRDSSAQVIMNALSDKVSYELSKKDTCSSAANFHNQPVVRTFTNGQSLYAADGTTPIITVGAVYGKKDIINNTVSSGTSSDAVEVSAMRTYVDTASGADTNQMILEISFGKKSGILSAFAYHQVVRLPITIIRTTSPTTNVNFCYNDLTNSIATAIRMSCRGSSSHYDATQNPPYGVCLHDIDTTVCGGNTFINKMEYDGTLNKLKPSCTGLAATCTLAGQVAVGFNLDGTLICDYPFPNCSPGQLMIKDSTGKYVCLKTDIGCTGNRGIKSFISSNTVQCAYYFPAQTCTGLVTNTDASGLTCASYYFPVTCGVGEFVSSFDNTGQPVCSKFYTAPQNCPSGYAATGLAAAGNLICQKMTRRTTCGGSYSPAGRTYDQCTAGGGTVINAGTSNAYCKFNASSCPGGWSQCSSYRQTSNTSCTDSNSACTTSVMQVHTISGSVFNDPVNPQTVTCDYWTRNSGPWVISCTKHVGAGPTSTTPITQVGCY